MKKIPPRRDLIGLDPDPPKERVPGSGLTKTGNLARPKTGGRTKGVPNKVQMSEDMRADLLTVYRRMGGVSWLLKWAKENPTEWVKLGLARLMPAPVRDDPEAPPPLNINVLSDFEAARRIAFVLESGHQELLKQGQTIDAPPLKPSPAMIPLEPVVFPIQYTEEELRELARKGESDRLVADTRGANSDYGGSAIEQGFSRRRKLI